MDDLACGVIGPSRCAGSGYRKGLAENGVSRVAAIVDEKQVPDDKYGLARSKLTARAV